MPTIGIIGANGQVGSEVCLFLQQMPRINVIPICRTELSSAYLRRFGFVCRHGSLDSADETRRLLKDCDLVADFSLPKGRPSIARDAIRKNITNVVQQSPPHARFVYISSIMAFGMSDDERFRRRTLARTIYGASKRYGERLAFRFGKQVGREVYVFRLGQVHGEIQAIGRSILRELRELRDEIAYVPKAPSYTVFAFTIAEALFHVASGKEQPGLYTLVSAPEWSWKELQEYYARRVDIHPRIVEVDPRQFVPPSTSQRLLSVIRKSTVSYVFRLAERHREVIASYLLLPFPQLERRIVAVRLRRIALAQINEGKAQNQYQPYKPLVGNILGQRLKSLSDSRISMNQLASKVRDMLNRAIDAS